MQRASGSPETPEEELQRLRREVAALRGATSPPDTSPPYTVTMPQVILDDDDNQEEDSDAAQAVIHISSPDGSQTNAPPGMSDEEYARFLQNQEEALASGARQTNDHTNTDSQIHMSDVVTRSVAALPTMVVVPSSDAQARRPNQENRPAFVQSRTTNQPANTGNPRSNTRSTRGDRVETINTANDAALAASLQQMELMRMAAANSADRQAAPEEGGIEDPVWGRFENSGGKPFKPHTLLLIAVCPCFVPPCCSSTRKAAWRRAACSASFVLAYIQFLLWIATLIPRGFAPGSVNPMLGPWPDTLDTFQAKNSAYIVYDKQLWRLVVPIFLHAGLVHLLANLGMQMRLGIALEYEWGVVKYLSIYFASGIYASVYSAAIKDEQLSVGASGALMGVFGAWVSYLLATWSEGDDIAQRQRGFQFIMAIANIAIIIGFSFVPYVDWAAHIFGLLAGVLLGWWLFAVRPDVSHRQNGSTTGLTLHNNNNRRHATTPAATGNGRCHIRAPRRYTAVAALVAFLLTLLAGLLGLFLNTNPPQWLLNYCQAMRLSYADYNLSC